jgi:HD-like signal output (HDOD) protein
MSAGQTEDVKRILFVDDDRYLLEGLRDALRPHRRRWSMTFVGSGDEALELLAAEPQDVVISDLRMPGMDGATLLARVRETTPAAVRIVLSGQAELRMVARAAGVAHRLLAKPCEIDDLTRVIERSCALQEITARVEMNRRLAGASALPSVPRLYLQLTDLLESEDGTADDAAAIVERDIAMTAKVLQLSNSAYFGRRNPVTSVRDAVAYLGLEALRALALSAETFRQFPVSAPIPGFDLEEFERHSTRVAQLARQLCEHKAAGDESFAAGLLHDVGLLVIAAQDRDELEQAIAASLNEGRPLHEVERDRHGVTHAEVGAHLLALWGLPHGVTEAVAHHHERPAPDASFDTVLATYIAACLITELESSTRPEGPRPSDGVDTEWLEGSRWEPQLERWRELASLQFEREPA